MLYGELRELSGASKGSELVRSVQAVYRQKLVPAGGRWGGCKQRVCRCLGSELRLVLQTCARSSLVAGPACAPSWSPEGSLSTAPPRSLRVTVTVTRCELRSS